MQKITFCYRIPTTDKDNELLLYEYYLAYCVPPKLNSLFSHSHNLGLMCFKSTDDTEKELPQGQSYYRQL